MKENISLDDLSEGTRLIYRLRYAIRLTEDRLLEKSPSGNYIKFEVLGWVPKSDLKHYEFIEVLDCEKGSEMCPNCVTPWKCNGPHLVPCRNAPAGSPQLESYLDSLGLKTIKEGDSQNES